MPVKCLLSQLREKKGWRQLDLARILKVGESTISRIETGRHIPDGILADELEKLFEYPLCDLLAPPSNPSKPTLWDLYHRNKSKNRHIENQTDVDTAKLSSEGVE